MSGVGGTKIVIRGKKSDLMHHTFLLNFFPSKSLSDLPLGLLGNLYLPWSLPPNLRTSFHIHSYVCHDRFSPSPRSPFRVRSQFSADPYRTENAPRLLGGLANIDKLGLDRSSSDKETVDIGLLGCAVPIRTQQKISTMNHATTRKKAW